MTWGKILIFKNLRFYQTLLLHFESEHFKSNVITRQILTKTQECLEIFHVESRFCIYIVKYVVENCCVLHFHSENVLLVMYIPVETFLIILNLNLLLLPIGMQGKTKSLTETEVIYRKQNLESQPKIDGRMRTKILSNLHVLFHGFRTTPRINLQLSDCQQAGLV